jgi:poly(beta-D-mannuronate) lyase
MIVKTLKNSFVIVCLLFIHLTKSQTLVNSASELQTAISNATAGSEIILVSGSWNNVFIDINKNGTASQPIIITAQNPGTVFLTGNSRVYMRGTYITVSGLVFQNPANLVVNNDVIEPIFELNQCDNCQVINNKIDAYNGTDAQKTLKFKWVYIVDGQHNEIAHNSFIGKYGVGSIINDNRSLANEDYLKIHHNYFADRTPVDNDINGLNDQDAIRIGTSTTSLSDSFSEVHHNLFNNWSGEVEIISNKSGKNKYYNNTFRDYQGTLTLRHGNECEVFNNYFFANNNSFSGGVRLIGESHKVYNNYIQGVNSFKPNGSSSNVTGAINVMNGVTNSALSGYYQVKNAQIVNNTIVNCDYAIRIGTSLGGTEEPENLIVANNIMLNSSINAYQINTSPSGTSVSEGNITQNGAWDLTNGLNNNKTVANGLLASGTDFYRIVANSAAIDANIGSYSFLSDDILGGNRTNNFDAGAEEFGANGTNLPYKVTDVGTKVGFLSAESGRLTTSLNNIDFNIAAGTKTFDINSNVSWSISENADWLTLNNTNGTNNETIEITASENTSGALRTATITISEDGGNLNSVITVNQSTETFNADNAVALTGIAVTGVGTQAGDNIPENTLDGDDSSRWSANSNDGSAFLTYDLQCKKTVTSVKIYFHKGDQRTSSFKIATSNDGSTFTDATAVLISSGNTVGFEDFALSPFKEVRYVRILGYGNSEGSGWNSYEEVQIFGDDICASLSLDDTNFEENKVTFYPNPAKSKLNIISDKEIGFVEIYTIRGQKIINQKITENKGNIETKSLAKGIYLIKINGVLSKFIVE